MSRAEGAAQTRTGQARLGLGPGLGLGLGPAGWGPGPEWRGGVSALSPTAAAPTAWAAGPRALRVIRGAGPAPRRTDGRGPAGGQARPGAGPVRHPAPAEAGPGVNTRRRADGAFANEKDCERTVLKTVSSRLGLQGGSQRKGRGFGSVTSRPKLT